MRNELVAGAVLIVLSCTAITKAQWTPDPFCPYPSDDETRYPYYGNCSVYWECYDGTKYVLQCPEGFEYNTPLQRCDEPSIARCDPYASTTANPNPPTYTPGSTTTLGPILPDCPSPSDELLYFPYAGDCTKYWECFSGNSYLYTCPTGLWWHEETARCDFPGEYCDNSPSTTTSTTSDSTVGSDPRCIDNDTAYWSQPGDCHKYVECLNGSSYVVDCPANLYFSETTKSCVRVDESECCQDNPCPPTS